VHDLKPRLWAILGMAAETPSKVHGRAPERPAAGRELVELDVETVETPERRDLVANEAAPLGMCGV
jgi:hypothetical protein